MELILNAIAVILGLFIADKLLQLYDKYESDRIYKKLKDKKWN